MIVFANVLVATFMSMVNLSVDYIMVYDACPIRCMTLGYKVRDCTLTQCVLHGLLCDSLDIEAHVCKTASR